MKKNALIVCLVFVFFSGMLPTIQNGKYHIKGTIDKSFDGQRVKLSLINDYQEIVRTDVVVINQGRFSFEGDEYLNNISSIIIEDGTEMRPLFILLESGTINVSFSVDRPYISGTPLNDIYTEYMDSARSLNVEISKLMPEWENGIIAPGSKSDSLFYTQGEYMMNFIKYNFKNPLGKSIFMSVLDIGQIPMTIYISKNINYSKKGKTGLDEIFTFVNDEIRSHPRFISYIGKWEGIIAKEEAMRAIIGMKIEKYSLLTPNGKAKKISDFFGKKEYVFLEFWASWCGPCLASIPQLKEIYKEYSDKLEIVSISLDTKQSSWTNALSEQSMPWPQLADLKGTDSDIAKAFGIKSIPFAVLLDKQGFVVEYVSVATLRNFIQNKYDK